MQSPYSSVTLSIVLFFNILAHAQIEGFTFVGSSKNCNPINQQQLSKCSNSSRTPTTRLTSSSGNNDRDELLRAAQDPKLFEEYVMKKMNKTKVDEDSGTMPGMANDPGRQIDEENKVKKGGYVSIEEWDETRSSDDLSWEEKVQFDGQKFGNRYNQNEILRKNLKSW